MAVEEQPFRLEAHTAQYDLRAYGAMVVAETRIVAGFAEAGPRGFRILASYLSGHNRSRLLLAKARYQTIEGPAERLAMTAPVSLVQTSWGFLVQFAMPPSLALATLPSPKDARVQLREIPARQVAVHTYTGSWSERRFRTECGVLLSALERDGLQAIGEPLFARFNSPFQFWFLRRNEIWVEVKP